jgi:ribosomal protein S18 acetylase RimI-like enzyme
VVHYRTFRNTDPPRLASLWNATFSGRGAVRLYSPGLLEQQVFAKPYFDPEGLLVAEDGSAGIVGFVHAGFGPDETQCGVNRANGVICALGVVPTHRRRGIGRELFRRAEAYLRERGSTTVQAGASWPRNPFYFGLYGGAELPGWLASEAEAGPFLGRMGYAVQERVSVLHRDLTKPLKVADGRFAAHRRNLDLQLADPKSLGSWWQECVFGLVEPQLFVLDDKATGRPAAQALVWEMEAFSERWHRAAVGIVHFHVEEALRRVGIGKFLLTQILRALQDQYFEVAEVQIHLPNEPGLRFAKSLEFAEVDEGRVYRHPE